MLQTDHTMLRTDHTKFCTNEPFAELRTIRRPAICMNGFLHRLQSPVFCICVCVLRQSCQVAGLQSGGVLLVGCPVRELADGRMNNLECSGSLR